LTVTLASVVLPEVDKLFSKVLPEADIFPAVISQVKVEVQVTSNCHNVAPSEVRDVMSQAVALKLVIVASVEVNVAMSQVVAVNQFVVVSQVTVKSAQAVISQVNVEVQSTVKFHSTVAFQAVNVAALAVAASKVVIVAASAVILPAVTSHSNPHSAVTLPVKVTSQFTVCNVTLSNDKSS
jgi:hypothetical protein